MVLTVVLLSRLQMNPQKLIHLKLNIHNETRGIQMFRIMQKGWSGWCFHWVPCLFGIAKSRTWLSDYHFHFCLFENSPAKGSSSVLHSHIIYQSQSSKHIHTRKINPPLRLHQYKISMNWVQYTVKLTIPVIKSITRKQAISAPDLNARLCIKTPTAD